MADKSESKPATIADKPAARADAPKASGVIVYCPGLNSWNCVRSDGRRMLTAGKATCIKRFPNYTVKE